MKKKLKILRVVFSLVVFILFIGLFVDFRELYPSWLAEALLFTQFIPSIHNFINITSIAAIGFIVILILTLLFGRVYCSFLCPLGILQDSFSYISKRFKKKHKYKFSKPWNKLRYGLLGLTVLFILFNSMLLLNLLDPYSNFGRIFTDLFKPGVIWLNNQVAVVFNKMSVYSVYPVDIRHVHGSAIIYAALVLVVLVVMAALRGRLYCNTICPVGTFLGFLSKYSVFKVRLVQSSCTSCGKCAMVCKSECIDIKNKEIDFTRCVDCYNCLKSCNFSALSLKPVRSLSHEPKEHKLQTAHLTTEGKATDRTKRSFLFQLLAWMIGLSAAHKILRAAPDVVVEKPSTIPEDKKYPVSPPGSKSIQHFKNHCTACHLCVSVCPTGVLQPSFLDYGFSGILQPVMDYHTSFCNYECTKCGDICPTGAILPLKEEKKKLTQIGKVYFIKENCVVHTQKTACGSCSEHCPTQAVYMMPYEGNLTIPETNQDICIGCGACEHACPVTPYKAIYVDGNQEHLKAEKPKTEKVEHDAEEDFPF